MKIKNNWRKLSFVLLLLLILAAGGLALAQGIGLEVKYPVIPGLPPLSENPTLPEYVRYLYFFSIIISGLIAFASLVYGGFRYLASAGSPVAMADARDQITAGVTGLIILLASFMILNILNPQLTFLRFSKLGPQPINSVCGNNICEKDEDSTSCPDDCLKTPEVTLSKVLEIPVGTLIEQLLNKTRLENIRDLSGLAEQKAGTVRNAALALKDEINRCDCGRANPNPSTCNAGICPTPPDPRCMGDPCDRNKINQLRQTLKNAYTDFEIWIAGGKLYREMARFRKDLAKLTIARVLLEEGYMPLNYDNWLEVKQTLMEAGQKVEVDHLTVLGETILGKQDSANFYFDSEINEELINELLDQLEAEIGMWDIIGDDDWTPFPVPPGQQIFIWPTTTDSCISQWYDSYNVLFYSGGCHRAIDINVLGIRGAPVVAAMDGSVYKVVNDCTEGVDTCGDYFGNYVAIEHQYGGITFYTVYAHLEPGSIPVSVGQHVNQGDRIGGADNTGLSRGDHLDFRLMTGDAPRGVPYDPLSYLPPPPQADCPACGDDCHRSDVCSPPDPPFGCSFGTGPCSVESLDNVFGSNAGKASMVCQKESSSNPFQLNDGCLSGDWDYSIGLFQINLFRTGRCPGAFREISISTCEIIDQAKLDQCMVEYGWGEPTINIQKALGISAGGTNWCAWSTACPQYCNICTSPLPGQCSF